ncbi:MAG: hypothetical protein ACJ789_04085 [Thermomicrobiales bacterium]
MYPHTSSDYKTPDAFILHGCGLNGGQVLAAAERHLRDQQFAQQWIATHPDRERAPRAWRKWSGNLLIRAGHRLEGVTPTIGVEIKPAMN